MVAIKAAEADRFVESPGSSFRTFLLFGPDSGLVSERADRLASKSGADRSDPFSVIRMDADTAAADAGRLADEAHTVPMFGGKRLIWVSGSTRRNLAQSVQPVLDTPPDDCWIVIEAGDLKRDSALRKTVEKSASGAAIGCYPDGPRQLAQLIDAEFRAAGLVIDDDARSLLTGQLGGDRQASRNELRKLVLYCLGRSKVSAADVTAICGDVTSVEAVEVIDLAACGAVDRVHEGLSRLLRSGTSPDMIMLAALRHFQLLHHLRHRVESERIPAAAAVAGLRPPFVFTRRSALETAVAIWPLDAIARRLVKLDEAAFECRAWTALGPSLAGAALVAIAAEGRNRVGRR